MIILFFIIQDGVLPLESESTESVIISNSHYKNVRQDLWVLLHEQIFFLKI